MLRQFDVHRFTGRTRTTAPYLVVVQSNAFRTLRRRLAIPLVQRDALPAVTGTAFPVFTIEGNAVVVAALDLASYPEQAFGEHVASLASEGDAIIGVVDIVIARGFN